MERKPSFSGRPQVWASLSPEYGLSVPTLGMPASIAAWAAAGWKPRLSCSLSTHSKLKLKKPFSVSSKPTLPATLMESSPS